MLGDWVAMIIVLGTYLIIFVKTRKELKGGTKVYNVIKKEEIEEGRRDYRRGGRTTRTSRVTETEREGTEEYCGRESAIDWGSSRTNVGTESSQRTLVSSSDDKAIGNYLPGTTI